MVRAILDGRKTQTRRVIKYAIPDGLVPIPLPNGKWSFQGQGRGHLKIETTKAIPCPYGEPGDFLWVRETWQAISPDENKRPLEECRIIYKATDKHPGLYNPDKPEGPWYVWRPSVHMPRWASRITLRVLNVRVERLHEITPEDCFAEGVVNRIIKQPIDPISDFYTLWDSITANRSFSWSQNPWVWVVEFEVTP